MIFLSTLLVKRSLQGKGQLGPVSFLFVCFLSQAHATHFTIMLATASLPFVNITKKLNTIFVLPTLLTVSTYAKRHEKKKKKTLRHEAFQELSMKLQPCRLEEAKSLGQNLGSSNMPCSNNFFIASRFYLPLNKRENWSLPNKKTCTHFFFFFFSNDQSSSMELKLQKQA